jgi:cupin fold WbuC family metalloprotein
LPPKHEVFATNNRPADYKASNGEYLHIDIESPVKVISNEYFKNLIDIAETSKRKRKMTDLTKDPTNNQMQVLMNTWTEGSYSPVHKHNDYSEAFVILDGALAFFTFQGTFASIHRSFKLSCLRNRVCCGIEDGQAKCHVITSSGSKQDKAIIVEAKQYHAMTAAPKSLGYPGHAIVFEISGHKYDASKPTKSLAPFAPALNDGLDGHPDYYAKILEKCPVNSNKLVDQ